MIERRGTAYIAPVASHIPSRRMVDPQRSVFLLSWQDWDDKAKRGELIESGGEITGAEAAIAWGRERCDRVLIRLGHTDDTHFSAGDVHLTRGQDGWAYPTWPPSGPACGGMVDSGR
jgi:hypothetical protein